MTRPSDMDGPGIGPPELIVAQAVRYAKASPCRSKRGVVIFRMENNGLDGYFIAGGFNAPPKPLVCDASDGCRATCSRAAVHAEQRALLDVGSRPVSDCDMLHVKVTDAGVVVPSDGPSCVECSKLALERGVAGFWLLHEVGNVNFPIGGWCRYPIVEFHRMSLAANGLLYERPQTYAEIVSDPTYMRIVDEERASRVARGVCILCGHGKPGHGGRVCAAPSNVEPSERCGCHG